ncbi:MAG: hypothetical protein WC477_00885 [Patescibacteria group bacterium]
MAKQPRFEWVSFIYLAFLVLAVLSPSMVRHNIFSIPEEQAEEILIFLFGATGLICFSMFEKWIDHKERERQSAMTDLDKARRELASSYEYIGAINRRIEALKKLANETVQALPSADTHERELFRSIAAGAATHVRLQHGMIRFVSLQKLRTLKEFSVDPDQLFRVSNRDLLDIHLQERSHAFVRDESGADVLVIPSSRSDMESKAFLLLQMPAGVATTTDIDAEILRVYANQAEVLYRVLEKNKGNGTIEVEAEEKKLEVI